MQNLAPGLSPWTADGLAPERQSGREADGDTPNVKSSGGSTPLSRVTRPNDGRRAIKRSALIRRNSCASLTRLKAKANRRKLSTRNSKCVGLNGFLMSRVTNCCLFTLKNKDSKGRRSKSRSRGRCCGLQTPWICSVPGIARQRDARAFSALP